MLTENLFEKILLEPAEQNFDTLCIVSGYASATMVSRHFDHLSRGKREVRIQLIVGMAIRDGISEKDHEGFRELAREHKDVFVCRYVACKPPVRLRDAPSANTSPRSNPPSARTARGCGHADTA